MDCNSILMTFSVDSACSWMLFILNRWILFGNPEYKETPHRTFLQLYCCLYWSAVIIWQIYALWVHTLSPDNNAYIEVWMYCMYYYIVLSGHLCVILVCDLNQISSSEVRKSVIIWWGKCGLATANSIARSKYTSVHVFTVIMWSCLHLDVVTVFVFVW